MTDSARIAVSSRRRLGAIDRAPRSPRRGERLASSAADEEVVEGASDLLAIAAIEDLRVDLEGDLRIAVADPGHDVGALPGSLVAAPFSLILLGVITTQIGALQIAPVTIAVITAHLATVGGYMAVGALLYLLWARRGQTDPEAAG